MTESTNMDVSLIEQAKTPRAVEKKEKKKREITKFCLNVSREKSPALALPLAESLPHGRIIHSLSATISNLDVSQLETQRDSTLTSHLGCVATKPRKPAATVVSEHSSKHDQRQTIKATSK
jgi:hypothetical protein